MIELNEANFKLEVLDCAIPVMVDFWASWCGPCRSLAPILEEFAVENEGKIKVCKLNVDDNEGLSAQFGVMSIPTVLMFKNGEVVNKSVGLVNKSALAKLAGI